MATYAIGDIQGCFDELLKLLDKIQFTDNDSLWIAGDLVNRGPKSLETLRFLKSLGTRAQIVLGNHDLHLLAVSYHNDKRNIEDTLDLILKAPDREELLYWLRHRPLIHHDAALDYVMVHAGLPPIWSLEEAKGYAQELELVIQGKGASEYFKHMYGNQPSCWNPSLESWDRLRLISNYLTRMCFCDSYGKLELNTKSGPNTPPEGFSPWYLAANKKNIKPGIIFGHWASSMGQADSPNVFSLDTGCVWGGFLTAMCLEDRKRYSISSAGYI